MLQLPISMQLTVLMLLLKKNFNANDTNKNANKKPIVSQVYPYYAVRPPTKSTIPDRSFSCVLVTTYPAECWHTKLRVGALWGVFHHPGALSGPPPTSTAACHRGPHGSPWVAKGPHGPL